MHESGLARELWPQLQRIAERQGLVRVTRVEMIIGMLHGVSADFLAHSFEHVFEDTSFEGAATEIEIVDPGDSLPTGVAKPGSGGVATGWELLVTNIEGES